MTGKSPAQIGYEAYVASIGYVACEPWEALGPIARDAISACVEAGTTAAVGNVISIRTDEAHGDTIVVTFNQPLPQQLLSELTERWAAVAGGARILVLDDVAGVANVKRDTGELIADLAGARRERDGAYRERAQLVAYLAACYRSVIMHDADLDAPGWSVIFIDTPSGQMSWHLHENDLDLFRHVPKILRHVPGPWDGHTADEKYRRLAELTTATAVARDVDDELRERIGVIRDRMEILAAGLELSASGTAPSKKSEIERGCAAAVRQIAEAAKL